MSVGRHNRQPRLRVEPGCRPPQRRQQQQGHEKGREDIDRDGTLVPLGQRALGRHHGHRGILHDGVHARQLCVGAATKRPDAGEAAQVQRPHLDDAVAVSTRAAPASAEGQGAFNVGLGRLASLGAAAGQDDFGGVETDKVAGGFEAETNVAAGHDDGLAGEVMVGVRYPAELVVEEGDEEVAVIPKSA